MRMTMIFKSQKTRKKRYYWKLNNEYRELYFRASRLKMRLRQHHQRKKLKLSMCRLWI